MSVLGSVALHGWVESAWYISSENTGEEVMTIDAVDAEPQAKVKIIREFRGGPVLAPLNVSIKMGPMGTSQYRCEVSKAEAATTELLADDLVKKKKRPGRPSLSKEELNAL